jgi:hypothetical protein
VTAITKLSKGLKEKINKFSCDYEPTIRKHLIRDKVIQQESHNWKIRSLIAGDLATLRMLMMQDRKRSWSFRSALADDGRPFRPNEELGTFRFRGGFS